MGVDSAEAAEPLPAPPPEIVALAARELNQADAPLASTARAERIARQVVAAYADRPLRPLTIWRPDPEIAAPMEAPAPAADGLELFGEGREVPYREAGQVTGQEAGQREPFAQAAASTGAKSALSKDQPVI
jgi:hypothetical protein